MSEGASASAAGVPPWEPPLCGPEVAQLLGAIDRQRWTFRWKAGELDEAGLRHSIGVSSLTLGGLLHHLALVEDMTFHRKLTGLEMPDIWADGDWDTDPDWEFTAASTMTAEELYRRYDEAVSRARSLQADRIRSAQDLDDPAAISQAWGQEVSARRVLIDVLEEYARHTGHADLLRESVDGRTGEDPPSDWRPA